MWPAYFSERVAGVLEALPADLEELALLRIHQLRFLRADAEEGGVEHRDVVEDAARLHVARVAAQGGGIDGSRSSSRKNVIDSRPAHRLSHSVSMSSAPGKRPDMPMIATGSIDCALWLARVAREARTFARSPLSSPAIASGVGFWKNVVVEIERPVIPRNAAIVRSASSELPPRLEEVVEDADAIEAEQVREGLADARLEIVRRRAEFDGELRPAHFGSGQGATVALAVRGEWQGGQQHIRRRLHEFRKAGSEMLADAGEPARSIVQHEVRDEPLVARTIFAREHRAAANVGVTGEHALDLAHFDAIAANLDLMVDATDELDSAIGQVTRQIAGAIEALRLAIGGA